MPGEEPLHCFLMVTRTCSEVMIIGDRWLGGWVAELPWGNSSSMKIFLVSSSKNEHLENSDFVALEM